MDDLTNNTCPEMPEWLKAISILVLAPTESDINVPADHLDILAIYRRAKMGDECCATQIAEKYESGFIPSGTSVPDALKWHEYASHLGSLRSKLRLAQLYLWTNSDRMKSLKAIEFAKELVAKVVMEKQSNLENMHAAAISALLLLEYDRSNEGLELVSELIELNQFRKHPNIFTISDLLSKLKFRSNHSRYTLNIIHQKIPEDGDFKAGVYKKLEQPLALVGLLNVDVTRATLDIEFPWFADVTENIYRQLVVRQLSMTPAFKLRPLLLAGPPGVGKTSYVKRLSELIQVPFRGVMAGGSNDSMYLRGTPRGWSSARPSGVIQAMAIEGIANPLFLVDELEKASSDNKNGRLWDILLQLLEPATAKVFLDECLCVACDLSWVSWVATVNEIGTLPKALLERFTVVVVKEPGPEYVNTLVKGAMDLFAKEVDIDRRLLPALNGDDFDVIARCNGPREINRIVRSIVEKKMVEDSKSLMRN